MSSPHCDLCANPLTNQARRNLNLHLLHQPPKYIGRAAMYFACTLSMRQCHRLLPRLSQTQLIIKAHSNTYDTTQELVRCAIEIFLEVGRSCGRRKGTGNDLRTSQRVDRILEAHYADADGTWNLFSWTKQAVRSKLVLGEK